MPLGSLALVLETLPILSLMLSWPRNTFIARCIPPSNFVGEEGVERSAIRNSLQTDYIYVL